MTEVLQDPWNSATLGAWSSDLGDRLKGSVLGFVPQLQIKMPGILAFLASHVQICTAKMHSPPPNVNDIDFYFSPTFSDNVCWHFRVARELAHASKTGS